MQNPRDPVNRKSLPERTADTLINMLHNENYRVGAKLPNEPEMAERFEVSRSTLRLALSILRERGIVYTERGSGTFVADFRKENETEYDPLGLSVIYDKSKLALDLLDMRMLIEPKCALLAAQNARRHDVEVLMHICDEFDKLVASGQGYVQKDMEFHQAIANCSGNLVVPNLIPYIHQMQRLTARIAPRKRREDTAVEHRRIAEAIADRRGADAYDLMQYHLSVIRERFIRSRTNLQTDK